MADVLGHLPAGTRTVTPAERDAQLLRSAHRRPTPADLVTAPGLFQQAWPEGDYRFFQLGFVVDDLFAAARRWVDVHRVGPFHVLRRAESPCTYRGQRSTIDMQVAVAQAGPVQIELIRVHSDGESIFTDYADVRAGLHQLCSLTYDFDASVAHYTSLGYEFVSEMGRDQRVGFFDTAADFGFYTEVAEAAPGFVEAVAGMARTSAEWDGTDPIRILTRDGYRTPEFPDRPSA